MTPPLQYATLTRLIAGALLVWSGSAGAQTAQPVQPASARATATASATTGAPAQAAVPAANPVQPATPGQAAKPVPEEEGVVVPSVTVSAERPTSRIDRQVYDVKSDINSTNGSASDALNNVPSVAVDPDGTVTLRGSTNVQILVDGKPSAMLQGENRGAALNALPSDDIESIEVINNPGAQFGNEGGGGPILNLVMRRNKRPGGLGIANANAGSGGRYNTGLSGSYNEGLWGFQGGINFRHDGRDSTGQVRRERIVPATGAVSRSTQDSSSEGLNDSASLNGMVSYNLGQRDKLAATWSYAKRSNDSHGLDRYVSYLPDGALDSDYARTGQREGDSVSYGWGGQYEHKGEADGEQLRLDLRVSSSDNEGGNLYANEYFFSRRGALDSRSRQATDTGNKIADFTGDYERALGKGTLKLGFKTARNDGDFDTRYVDVNPVTGGEVVNPMRTNRFAVTEDNLALYGSYQWRFNETWGMLAGLRAEYTRNHIDQLTQALTADNQYMSYLPSLFATYKASDKSNVRLAYARRIRRPNVNDLNPFVVYRDEFNVSSGNPNLRPTKVDSVELGYETTVGVLDTSLRLYARRESDLISERRYFVSESVLLTTRDNDGRTRSSGVEFSANGKLLPKLSVNVSGNVAFQRQRVYDDLDEESLRSASAFSVRGRFNYQLSADDQLQLMLNRQGKALFGQGYRQPTSSANFSWRHAITPKLNMVLNVTDVFDSNKTETITDTATVRDNTLRRFDGRIVYVGLSYRLGGVTPTARSERQGQGRGMGEGRGPGAAGRQGAPQGEGGAPGF